MNDDDRTRLEHLPNEILSITFEYLETRNLYRAFENLNARFNALIRSVYQPLLVLSPSDFNHNLDEAIFSPSIYNLIVQENAEVIVGYFPNVHRLILHWLPRFVLDKLELNILPHLEYLSIRTRQSPCEGLLLDFADRLFTNSLPQLRFCSIPDMSIRKAQMPWQQTPAIHILKIGYIDLHIYANILRCCPNLRIFEFELARRTEIPSHIEHHLNIKTLVIKQTSLNHRNLKACLSSVPNLQRLDICTKDSPLSLRTPWSRTNWLNSEANLFLPKFDNTNVRPVVIMNIQTNAFDDAFILRLERNFEERQADRYQTKSILHREKLD